MTEKETAKAFLRFLEDRFKAKINPEKYYLAYSGGKDSHLLYWFIKEWMKDDRIIIVGVNTGFEIPEIRDRILRNCDIVLHPIMHREKVKEKYGIPCFSKQQDEYVYRYQNGNRSENTMKFINGENPVLNLNKKARKLLLEDGLHKISNKCCLYSKELPMMKWGKLNGRKAITGVRGSESLTRKAKYSQCLKKNGDFTPLYDWTDDLMDLVYSAYDIPVPECYQYVERTGCAGCPYGRHVETELSLLSDLQKRSIVKYFRESYDVLGVDYKNIQMTMYQGDEYVEKETTDPWHDKWMHF